MANSKECAVCKQMMKSKHKFDKFYRIGFWVLLIFSIIISVLYFGSGEVFTKTENITEINNNSKVDIANGNNNSINIDNGDYNIP